MINTGNPRLDSLLGILSQTTAEIAKEIPKNIQAVYDKMSPEHGQAFIIELEKQKVNEKLKDLSDLVNFVKKNKG